MDVMDGGRWFRKDEVNCLVSIRCCRWPYSSIHQKGDILT